MCLHIFYNLLTKKINSGIAIRKFFHPIRVEYSLKGSIFYKYLYEYPQLS